MVTAGIIAEYNPFHNGHKYQLEQIRNFGATHIAVAMSGAAVQRGDIAIYDKYERAAAAVKNGADLVIELPCPFSCSNAEVFADSGVKLLASLGKNVVNYICFSCETPQISLLNNAKEVINDQKFSKTLRENLNKGMSYPAAVGDAAGKIDNNAGEILKGANNTLAVEYIRSAEKFAPWIEFLPIQRIGCSHDSQTKNGKFISGSAIREILKNQDNIEKYVPYKYSGKTHFIENAEKAVFYKIMTATKSEILNTADVNDNIADRFLKIRQYLTEENLNLEEFMNKIKSKNITLARIRRIILFLTLGVKKEDIRDIPYGRILAFNDRGREILKKSKDVGRLIKYDTSLKKLETISEYAQRVSQLERNAAIFQDICCCDKQKFTNEYRQKISIKS